MHNSIEEYESIANESESRSGHRSNINVFNYHSFMAEKLYVYYNSKKIIYIHICID